MRPPWLFLLEHAWLSLSVEIKKRAKGGAQGEKDQFVEKLARYLTWEDKQGSVGDKIAIVFPEQIGQIPSAPSVKVESRVCFETGAPCRWAALSPLEFC